MPKDFTVATTDAENVESRSKVRWRGAAFAGERLAELLVDPRGAGVVRSGEVKDAADAGG